MEVVGGGASVLAFIAFAAQSTKTISEFLVGIQGAPANVERATRTVAMLQETLAQLAQCRAVNEAAPAQNIKAQMKSCSDDLAEFALRLSKLQLVDTDSTCRKAWKRIRTTFNEKDLDTMTTAVAAHSSTLGLWLVSSQYDSIHNSTELVSSLSQNVRAGIQGNSVHWNALQEKMEGISTDLLSPGLRRDEQSSASQTTLKQIESALSTTQTRTDSQLLEITSTLNESGARSREEHQSIYGMCSLILNALESLGSTLPARQEPTGTVLRQLQEQAEATRQQNPNDDERWHIPQAKAAKPVEGSMGRVLGDVKVLNSIDRLCNLTDHKQCTAGIGDVGDIIDDLRTALRAAQELRKESADARSLERAWGLLSTTERLSINEGAKLREQLAGHVTRNDLVRREYDVPNGILTISNRQKRLKRHSFCEGEAACGRDAENVDEFTAKLSFFSRSPTGRMFSATIKLQDRWDSTLSFIPRLEVNRVMPNHSPVFELVRCGLVKELRELLKGGGASLRDHDEFGNSLLVLAMHHLQPEMCRYLLSHHADVDAYCFYSSGADEIAPILACSKVNEDKAAIEDLARMLECQRLLLDAGADPTDCTEPAESALLTACSRSVFEPVKLMLDRIECYTSIGSKNLEDGMTLFLIACENFGSGYSKPVFSLYLERGASILDLDCGGLSCLHICLARAGSSNYSGERPVEQEQEALVYLVSKGANVRAKDCFGRSVSHIVYSKQSGCDYPGSYRRDLWDSVLAICGYQVSEIRGDFRRVGCYTRASGHRRKYTTGHFRLLWAGWEHLCPYPEDLAEGEDDFEEFGDSEDDGSENERPYCHHLNLTCENCGWETPCPDPNCDFCVCGSDSDHDSDTGERPSSQIIETDDESSPEPGKPSTDPTPEPQDSGASIAPFDLTHHSSPIWESRQELAGQPGLGESQVDSVCLAIPAIDFENPWEDSL